MAEAPTAEKLSRELRGTLLAYDVNQEVPLAEEMRSEIRHLGGFPMSWSLYLFPSEVPTEQVERLATTFQAQFALLPQTDRTRNIFHVFYAQFPEGARVRALLEQNIREAIAERISHRAKNIDGKSNVGEVDHFARYCRKTIVSFQLQNAAELNSLIAALRTIERVRGKRPAAASAATTNVQTTTKSNDGSAGRAAQAKTRAAIAGPVVFSQSGIGVRRIVLDSLLVECRRSGPAVMDAPVFKTILLPVLARHGYHPKTPESIENYVSVYRKVVRLELEKEKKTAPPAPGSGHPAAQEGGQEEDEGRWEKQSTANFL